MLSVPGTLPTPGEHSQETCFLRVSSKGLGPQRAPGEELSRFGKAV